MITDEKLNKLAKLARIEIKDNEREKIKSLLDLDIESVKDISSIDTDGLEALTNPYDMVLNNIQEDVVSDGDKQEEIINCAPQSMYNYFTVPKVVE
ncbi:MAG: Asp-tRNA(Asn)/Glu-tRNA(Gln) amidotransferase subunit GatC [Rickettsiales bacterium]|nr:Asp-tRNA(Asn)/Glu-tRNA(Gln) amidotransferase subunit GatC [Rickettsiales bacterium]